MIGPLLLIVLTAVSVGWLVFVFLSSPSVEPSSRGSAGVARKTHGTYVAGDPTY